ncbi:MAG: hypothetical protein AAF919_08090 [Pseudomonadota bacterium]
MSEEHSEATPAVYYHGGKASVPEAEIPFRIGILAGVVAFIVLSAVAVLLMGMNPVVASILAALLSSGTSVFLIRGFARWEASNRLRDDEEYLRDRNAEVEARIVAARKNGSFQRWENQ